MQANYETSRLLLNELLQVDAGFIRELVNTPEWIKFIGERNIKTSGDATRYAQKLIDDPAINYWVVKLKDSHTPIGVVTLIKHDYLDHWDIGFAFLSNYTKQGYAHEAVSAILNAALTDSSHSQILAVSIKENSNSIQLLEKLGLQFVKEIQRENEVLLLFGITPK
jgi:[ribosomal protein S5]-alanine N-acetyltransferase